MFFETNTQGSNIDMSRSHDLGQRSFIHSLMHSFVHSFEHTYCTTAVLRTPKHGSPNSFVDACATTTSEWSITAIRAHLELARAFAQTRSLRDML